MSIREVTSTEQLLAMAGDWNDLWLRDRMATPFQSPHWLLPWWEHFGNGELLTLALEDDGRLDALAPLYILRDEDSDESLGLLLGTGISDYLDVLSTGESGGQALVAHLAKTDCQLWDLQQLRPSSSLLSAALPSRWSENVEDQEQCPVLSIEGAGNDLENITSTHFRKRLRYSRRSIERFGPVTLESASNATLGAMMTALFELHAARWGVRNLPGVLADDVIQSFHRQVAQRMLDAGSLRMYAMRAGERIVAIFYGFAHQDTVYFYLSGYEPALEKLSVGTVIVAHAIREAVRSGAKAFDFLRGAEEYKYAWGAKDRLNRRRQLIRGD